LSKFSVQGLIHLEIINLPQPNSIPPKQASIYQLDSLSCRTSSSIHVGEREVGKEIVPEQAWSRVSIGAEEFEDKEIFGRLNSPSANTRHPPEESEQELLIEIIEFHHRSPEGPFANCQ
jgi:hypothetical protein